MNYRLEYSSISTVGLVRQKNEDNLWCVDSCLPDAHEDYRSAGQCDCASDTWFAVFDGMGGEAHGADASSMAANEFGRSIKDSSDPGELTKAMNSSVCQLAQELKAPNMGTTVAAVNFAEGVVNGFNVGDSRIYCYSGTALNRLSVDHVSVMPDGRSFLGQNIGIPESCFSVEADTFSRGYHDGDIYMICSDGLTGIVPDRTIREILGNQSTELEDKIKALEALAIKRGAPDNTTIILIKVCEH